MNVCTDNVSTCAYYSYLCTNMKRSTFQLRIPPALKRKFDRVAEFYSTTASARIRELITKDVRNFERKEGRIDLNGHEAESDNQNED